MLAPLLLCLFVCVFFHCCLSFQFDDEGLAVPDYECTWTVLAPGEVARREENKEETKGREHDTEKRCDEKGKGSEATGEGKNEEVKRSSTEEQQTENRDAPEDEKSNKRFVHALHDPRAYVFFL